MRMIIYDTAHWVSSQKQKFGDSNINGLGLNSLTSASPLEIESDLKNPVVTS